MKSERFGALKPGKLNLAAAAKTLNAATPGLGTSVCFPPKNIINKKVIINWKLSSELSL